VAEKSPRGSLPPYLPTVVVHSLDSSPVSSVERPFPKFLFSHRRGVFPTSGNTCGKLRRIAPDFLPNLAKWRCMIIFQTPANNSDVSRRFGVTAFGFPHLPALGRKMRSQASSLWFRAAVLGAMILPAVLLAQVSAPPGAAPAVPAGWLHRDLLFPEPGFPERTEAVPVSLGEVSAPVAATMAVPDDWIRHDLVSSPPLFGASRVFPPTGSSEISFETLRPVEGAIPVPSDWSHRHLIFSRPAPAEQADRR
jgi:hypothetical protein